VEAALISIDMGAVFNQQQQYDENAKNLLAIKEFLAYILKYVTDEFKDMTIQEIIPCIEGTPSVGTEYVDPGQTNIPKITGSDTEDNIPGEGRVTFDIKFPAIAEYCIKVILNIEAQKTIKLKYPIEKRMVYYLARMISSQKNREFTKDNYQHIKKVYSIWICMNVEDIELRDTITKFRFTKENICGNYQTKEENYDLMTGVIVCVSNTENDKDTQAGSKLLSLMRTLFSTEITLQEKKQRLESNFGIRMTEDIDRRLDVMCNLSYGIYEKGEKSGELKGELEERKRLVRNMYDGGISLEQIAEICKCGKEEIAKLLNIKTQMQ